MSPKPQSPNWPESTQPLPLHLVLALSGTFPNPHTTDALQFPVNVSVTSSAATDAPSAIAYIGALLDVLWNVPWQPNCINDTRRSYDAPWPSRCALPAVQYGYYDETYIDATVYSGNSLRPFYSTCRYPASSDPYAFLEPYSMPWVDDFGIYQPVLDGFDMWWGFTVNTVDSNLKWIDPAWTAQGAWLGGQDFRDAVWNFGTHYCSWPFVECSSCENYDIADPYDPDKIANGIVPAVITALDFRNASLYIYYLDFGMFPAGSLDNVWYL